MTTTVENNLLELATFTALLPVQAVAGLLWLLWQGCTALWPYRRYIAIGAAAVGAVALCVAYPLLPMGLGIVGAFGWATYPQGVQHA